MKKFTTKQLVRIALLLSLLVVSSYIAIPTAYVTFTMQILMIFIIMLFLPFLECLILIVVYILMGLIGLPVFSGGTSGITASFGFLIGFFTIVFLTAILKRIIKTKNTTLNYIIISLVDLIVIYTFGALFFMIYLDVSFEYALSVAILPFIVFDICKIIIASVITERLQKIIKLNENKESI